METANERLKVIVNLAKGPDVLHIGCIGLTLPRTKAEDNHWLHSQLCNTFGCHNVLGVDINRTGLDEMAKRGFTVLEADAENLELAQRSFDTIVAGELIEHLANPGRFLAGCLRHLKPGGTVILSTPNVFSVMAQLAYLKKFTRCAHPEHTQWFCAQTITQLAERIGFRINSLSFVDDLRPDIASSQWYQAFCYCYGVFHGLVPRRFKNTIVVTLSHS